MKNEKTEEMIKDLNATVQELILRIEKLEEEIKKQQEHQGSTHTL